VDLYLTAAFAGIGTGGIYALVALSYNVAYASTGVFNFAQGDLVTLGALVTYSLLVTEQWNVLLVLVPVVLAVAAVGVLQQQVTVAPFVRNNPASFAWVITTLGASVILQNLFQLWWGSGPNPVPALWRGVPFRIFDSPIPRGTIIIVGAAISCVLVIELASRRTLFGRAWRATAQDAEAASIRGVDVRKVGAFSFLAAGALAGIGGFIIAPVTPVLYSTGAVLSLQAFVAIVIGGFGSAKGALAGGLILGIVQAETATIWRPEYRDVITLALLIIVLMIKPSGLFGVQRERQV
jgi:branched-chain amino acid transport system permease protein